MLLISILTHLVALVFTFNALCILCDDYLIPAVEVFIEQFQVPEEVAAVTFVAFGSAAPELFLNSVSAVAHTSDLSLSAVIGSGMIAFGLIPSFCMLTAVRYEMKLKVFPVLRECGFYVIGLVIFLSCIYDGKLETNEAIAIVSVYLVYVVMVILIYHHELHLRRVNAIFAHYPQIANALLRGAFTAPASSHTPEEDAQGLLDEPRRPSTPNANSNGGGMLARIVSRPSVARLFIGANAANYGDAQDLHSPPASPRASTPVPPSYPRDTSQLTQRITSSSNSNNSYNSDSSTNPNPNPASSMTSSSSSARYRGNGSGSGSPVYSSHSESPSDLLLITENASVKHSHTISGNHNSNGQNVFEDIEAAVPVSQHSTIVLRSYELVLRSISVPIRKLFQYIMPTLHVVSTTLPASHPQYVPLSRALSVLLMCFVCISLSASVIVMVSESLIKSLHIDSAVVGATVVALGSEIPDMLSAIALAKSGYFDGAIAGALGSQVINISIGVGLPALLVGLTGKAGQLTLDHHEADSIWYLACLLLVVIASYVYLTLPLQQMYRERTIPDFTTTSKSQATIQICVCLAMYAIYLYVIEG